MSAKLLQALSKRPKVARIEMDSTQEKKAPAKIALTHGFSVISARSFLLNGSET